MKTRNLYIYVVSLVLIYTSLILEYYGLTDCKALSVLLQAYSGVNLFGSISGYTIALYIGINVSLIIITISYVNSLFDLYNYIYVRCHTTSHFISLCIQNCVYNALSIVAINSIINLCPFMLLDKRIDINFINLSIYLFVYIVTLFVFEYILFSLKFKISSTVLLVFTVVILLPIFNCIRPNHIKWIVPFPISEELFDYKIIIFKLFIILMLLFVLYFSLKNYDGITNGKESL